MMWRWVGLVAVAVVTLVWAQSGDAQARSARDILPRVADLPPGWSIASGPGGPPSDTFRFCDVEVPALRLASDFAEMWVEQSRLGPSMQMLAARGTPAEIDERWSALQSIPDQCSWSTDDGWKRDLRRLSFPNLGDETIAFRGDITGQTNGTPVYGAVEYVYIRTGSTIVGLSHLEAGISPVSPPITSTTEQFARILAGRAR